VRFVADPPRADQVMQSPDQERPARSFLEVWGGNYYGDLEGPTLASRSVDRETEFVFAENEWPVIPAERSLVVIIRDPPTRWAVDVDSVFRNGEGRIVERKVRIDNFGTAREFRDDDRSASQPAPALTSRAA
jgi:hypothetical protein